MVVKALLVALVAFLASIDEQTFGACMMSRPLFTGPIIGLIMGDMTTGIIMGASLEAMFMGSIMVGSAVPPEVYASSVLSIAVAIQSGAGVGTAVALALPLSVFLQMWRNFCYAIPGSWAGKQIDKAVNERNLKKANLLHLTVVPLSIGIPSALLVFVAVAFGADTINSVLNMIPDVVMDGFNVAAGVLSCVGLALLIKMMSNNKIMPFLFIGFIAVMYLGMDVIGVAVAGLCMALIAVNSMKFEESERTTINRDYDSQRLSEHFLEILHDSKLLVI